MGCNRQNNKTFLCVLVAISVAGCTNYKSTQHSTRAEECETATSVQVEQVGSATIDGDVSLDNAKKIASGYGLDVYMEITDHTDCYDVCKLYIENSETHAKQLLLETKGGKQLGTKLSIKARNKAAYGMNEYGCKEEAGYEDGYIEAIEDVFILSPSKILVRGIPDCHNYYYYIIDVENLSAVHIDEYSGYKGMVEKEGNKYMEFTSADYSSGKNKVLKSTYDLSGHLVNREDVTAEYKEID